MQLSDDILLYMDKMDPGHESRAKLQVSSHVGGMRILDYYSDVADKDEAGGHTDTAHDGGLQAGEGQQGEAAAGAHNKTGAHASADTGSGQWKLDTCENTYDPFQFHAGYVQCNVYQTNLFVK